MNAVAPRSHEIEIEKIGKLDFNLLCHDIYEPPIISLSSLTRIYLTSRLKFFSPICNLLSLYFRLKKAKKHTINCLYDYNDGSKWID